MRKADRGYIWVRLKEFDQCLERFCQWRGNDLNWHCEQSERFEVEGL